MRRFMQDNTPRAPRRRALPCLVLLAGLAACATTPPAPQAAGDQGLDAFAAGDAALSCGAACAGAWRQQEPALRGLYDAAAWRELAKGVIRLNYRQDLGYFYLGRAAEGLGLRSAALGYYRAATALATGPDASARCSATAARCDGLSLLTESLLRIQAVSAPRGSARAARARAAEPAGWVDPPPVAQPPVQP
jgi:hypothetical protein